LGTLDQNVEIPPKLDQDVEILPKRTVQECGLLALQDFGSVDIAIVIDSSASTEDPSGFDINRNGILGRPQLPQIGRFDIGLTDPGDSILAAQVAAARFLVSTASNGDTRFSVISFSGVNPRVSRDSGAIVLSELSADIDHLEAALLQLLDLGSAGPTKFSAGMVLANQTLTTVAAPNRIPRRLALLISDTPVPVLLQRDDTFKYVDPDMRAAFQEASDSGIVFNTFGLGEAAIAKPPHPLGAIARATGGVFTPVKNAGLLHCDLIRSLAPRK